MSKITEILTTYGAWVVSHVLERRDWKLADDRPQKQVSFYETQIKSYLEGVTHNFKKELIYLIKKKFPEVAVSNESRDFVLDQLRSDIAREIISLIEADSPIKFT